MNDIQKEIDEIFQNIQRESNVDQDIEEEPDTLEVMQAIKDFKAAMSKNHINYVMTTSFDADDEQKVGVHLGGSPKTVLDLMVYTVHSLKDTDELTTLNKLDFMHDMPTELRDMFEDVKNTLNDDD